MKKRASSNLLISPDAAANLQLVVDALAALLKQQKPAAPTKPLRKVARQVAKGPPRDRHGFRGVPPPAIFDLYGLPETNWLTEYETAAVTRLSISTLAAWRKRPNPPLRSVKIGGSRIRYPVAAVKQYIATGERPRPGRPRKQKENGSRTVARAAEAAPQESAR